MSKNQTFKLKHEGSYTNVAKPQLRFSKREEEWKPPAATYCIWIVN